MEKTWFDMGTDIVFKISQELNRTFKFADTFFK